ncbi:MAG: urease subunit beta [Nocardioidaceae bacterium]|nr:MAG: urease subunit beta [Nocardioidaceae bacterium]
MNLTPTESERLTVFAAAEFARRNRAAGVPLSHPEAVALLADEMMFAARRDLSYEEIVDMACRLLTHEDVAPGVPAMIPWLSLEASFAEGTKVLVVFQPITAAPGEIVPGEVIPADSDIAINADRPVVELEVLNTGDRDIQVRSHAHFFEVNRALEFERSRAFGLHLDTPSGVGARFEPGIVKTVRLVPFGGNRRLSGFGGLTNGPLDDPGIRDAALALAHARGYRGA